jgi:tellurite resistance protein TerA
MLVSGANAALSHMEFSLDVALPRGTSIDVTAMTVYAGGQVRGDEDLCFFNQKSIWDGGVRLNSSDIAFQRFDFNLERIPSDVEKIVLTAAIEIPGVTFGQAGDVDITGPDLAMKIEGVDRQEAALILCEIYKRNGTWKVRNVSQGFNGGLAALLTHFGVELQGSPSSGSPAAPCAPPRAPLQSAQPTKPVNLSKITLTKTDKSVSLKKKSGRFGKILVNLNWNQRQKSGGIFKRKSPELDLDLGAFVEDLHGNVTAVQALGNSFGSFNRFPFVKLLGDDRSGASTDGEWLEINGDMWPEFKRILIYAFIYEGAPNWRETDGVVRVMVPGQPEIEVRMNEYDSLGKTCAVAYLENRNDQIKISREVTFHLGQKVMDQAYDWGLRWRTGSK